MDVSTRFKRLAEQWFLTEPAFFAILCTHELAINPRMSVPIRTGKGRIEYNPNLIEPMSDFAMEELLGIEMLRLFLKHPYERTPENVSRVEMKAASDMTLTSHYRFSYHLLANPNDFGLPSGKPYEWYLNHLHPPKENDTNSQDPFPGLSINRNRHGGDSNDLENQESVNLSQFGANNIAKYDAELTELWEEDESRQLDINELIETVKDWGTIPGAMSNTIIANTKAKIDYRKVLSGFRASVISTARCLTRMKPNRRTGFAHMGSKHDFSTRLLIAVDVSASISDKMLSHFFSVITKFFKYGIQSIDVIQFDTQIKGDVLSLEKAKKQTDFKVTGRGGTCFQPVFDYIDRHSRYDGLIILTDGYAAVPTRKRVGGTRVLWVCQDENTYNEHYQWMRQLGRVCYMNLR